MRLNRLGSVEYLNSLLKLSLLADVEKPINNLDCLQYNSSTDLWETTRDLGEINSIQFDLTPGLSPSEGLMYWNVDDGTVNIGMPGGNVNLQVGQEINKRVRNTTGSTILNGTPVYISGQSGTKLLITPADATFGAGVAFRTYAVATEDILHNSDGYVTKIGSVRDVNLTSFTAGTALYLAAGGSGAIENYYTSSPPAAPDVTILIGVVEDDTASGTIDVRIDAIPNLNSLSDVDNSGLVDNGLYHWDSASNTFKNSTTLTGITLDGSPTIDGPWSWTGDVTAEWTGDKIIELANAGGLTFKDEDGQTFLALAPVVNQLIFGSSVLGQAFIWQGDGAFTKAGSGLTTLGGNLLVDGGDIGITTDPDLIQLATGQVDVNGDLVAESLTLNTTVDGTKVLNVLGSIGTSGGIGQAAKIKCGDGGAGTSSSGSGGIVELLSGNAGNAVNVAGLAIAAPGGRYDMSSGMGGDATGSSIFGRAGAGGAFNLFSGDGGEANGTAPNTGGAGGVFSLVGGNGGDAINGSSNTGGAGGDIRLDGGVGGTGATANGASGNIYLGGSNGNVRIGDTTAPTVEFELNGRNVWVPTELSVTAAGGITPTQSEHGIIGNGGAVEITANPQIAAGSPGQLLILEGRSDSNTVTLNTGNGVHLHGKATMGDHDILTLRYDGVNSEWTEVSRNFSESEKSWSFASPTGASGTFYSGGFYAFNSGNSTFVAPQTLGTANVSYAAHAFIVAGTSPGSDSVITVTGTSITDAGVRTAGDSEALSVLSTVSANDYFETSKKWIGQMTFTFTSGDNTVNYNWGMCKYWDNNNNDFKITGIEVTGTAGPINDSAPNFLLRHHKATGWTYNAGSTPTPPTAVADMNSDHVTEIQTSNSQPFAWKRSNLAETVAGASSEGTIIEWITSSNKAIEIAHVLLRIRGN